MRLAVYGWRKTYGVAVLTNVQTIGCVNIEPPRRFSSLPVPRPSSLGSKKFLGVVIFLITFALSDTPYLNV